MSFPEEDKSLFRESASSPEEAEILLPIFREEIRLLKEAEQANKANKKDGTVNLLSVNVDELTLEDMEMWEAVKNYSVIEVSIKVFEKYRAAARERGNQSRADFAGFVANKLSVAVAWGNIHGLYE